VLSIVGTTTEWYGLTEVMVADASDVVVSETGASVAVESLTEAPESWEAYEGVVVTIPDVTLTGEFDDGDEPMTDWGIAIEDTFIDLDGVVGPSFASVTGVVTYNWDTFKIAPRSLDELVE